MIRIEKNLGYEFKNKELLSLATAHSSYINECHRSACESNERLEFLGDSVLSVITADYLYRTYTTQPEGVLSKVRAVVVCNDSLAVFSRKLEIGSFLKLGKGERMSDGANRDSILAKAFEALMAAVYLDSDIENVKRIYMPMLIPALDSAVDAVLHNRNKDFKTRLQEIFQQNHEKVPTYEKVKEEGPDHNKLFTYQVSFDNNVLGVGTAKSIKDAEQAAAYQALVLMGEEGENEH